MKSSLHTAGDVNNPGHTIAILHVVSILEGARRRGLDIPGLLRRAGIAPALVQSPRARVSQEQYARLLSLLSRAMGDEYFGLCRSAIRPGAFAHLCRELILCDTLGEALRKGFAFHHLLFGDFVARLAVVGGEARVTLHDRVTPDDAGAYARRMFLFFAWGIASWLVARRLPLLGVTHRETQGVNRAANRHLFQAPVYYGQPVSGFALEARWLALPVVQNRLSLDGFLRQAPASLLVKYRDEASCTERVRRLLRRHLGGPLPTLEDAGAVLGMAPQTLRRRLREEDESFRHIKDRLRCDAAIQYLARAELSLQDVAALVGFSELSTFHRAFKKWTDLAPGEYRYTRLRSSGITGATAVVQPPTGNGDFSGF